VFKCLTDNILLDDFKSVLQKLGSMEMGQRTATGTFRDSMSPSKVARSEHLEDEGGPASNTGRSRCSAQSDSMKVIYDENGQRRNPYNNTGNKSVLGKYTVKIQNLPKLPFPSRHGASSGKSKAVS
jgi:hypothetical protein